MSLLRIQTIETIEIVCYPQGNYFVSANCGPEKDIELMEKHHMFDEFAVVINNCSTIASTYDEEAAKQFDKMLFHLSLRECFDYKRFEFGE